MMKKGISERGFTLVELVVVIAILGVLAAVAVPSYMGYQHKSRVSLDIETANELIRQVRVKEVEKGSAFNDAQIQEAAEEFAFSSASSSTDGDSFSLFASSDENYTLSVENGKIIVEFTASDKKAGKYSGKYIVEENAGVTQGHEYFLDK